jgi:hypothetical protein
MKNFALIVCMFLVSLLASCRNAPEKHLSQDQINAAESIPKHNMDTLAGKDHTRIADSLNSKKAK